MVRRAGISTPRGPRMTLTRLGFCESGTFRNGFGAERRQGPARGGSILNSSVPVAFRSCCFACSGPVPVFRAWSRNAFPVRSGLVVPVVFRSRSGRFRSLCFPVRSGPCFRFFFLDACLLVCLHPLCRFVWPPMCVCLSLCRFYPCSRTTSQKSAPLPR